jgi:hypothetical protein
MSSSYNRNKKHVIICWEQFLKYHQQLGHVHYTLPRLK